MSKFNVAYVKKNPFMFGAIFVVFGLLLWLYLNRGGSSAVVYANGNNGPSEALQAAGLQAQTQLQLGQLSLQSQGMSISGQREIAAMEMSFRVAELQATHDIGIRTIESSLAALALQTNAQTSMAANNNAFMIDYARVAADSATEQLLIGASLQRDLGAQQLEGYKYSRAIDGIGSLAKKRRDEALTYFLGVEGGDPRAAEAAYGSPNGLHGADQGGGGFNPISLISPVAGLIAGRG